MHHVMHHAMHHAMHYVMHYVMHQVLHSTSWRPTPFEQLASTAAKCLPSPLTAHRSPLTHRSPLAAALTLTHTPNPEARANPDPPPVPNQVGAARRAAALLSRRRLPRAPRGQPQVHTIAHTMVHHMVHTMMHHIVHYMVHTIVHYKARHIVHYIVHTIVNHTVHYMVHMYGRCASTPSACTPARPPSQRCSSSWNTPRRNAPCNAPCDALCYAQCMHYVMHRCSSSWRRPGPRRASAPTRRRRRTAATSRTRVVCSTRTRTGTRRRSALLPCTYYLLLTTRSALLPCAYYFLLTHCQVCWWHMTDGAVLGVHDGMVIRCVDTYAPGPPHCTYGLRVPASCVLYVSAARGSWCATVRTPYACQPHSCRTYRGATGCLWG